MCVFVGVFQYQLYAVYSWHLFRGMDGCPSDFSPALTVALDDVLGRAEMMGRTTYG